MKTYKNTTVTKKHIQTILRTMDRTQIFSLYHHIYGTVNRGDVYNFIREYAPTNRVFYAAYKLAYTSGKSEPDTDLRAWREYLRKTSIQRAMAYFREQLKDTGSRYAKRPILGHSNLYFASPVYGHEDYNKWQCMPIQGNEQFCNTLVRVADRYFA